MRKLKGGIVLQIEREQLSGKKGPKEIYSLTQEEVDYQDMRVANGEDINDNNATWYCDCCDETMNFQVGFTCEYGTWTCTRCGYVNDVTPSNIIMWD